MSNFTLQDLVSSTLRASEERTKIAMEQSETPEEKKKREEEEKKDASSDKPSNTTTAPERNEDGIQEKVSSVFVEKLASAVEVCNGSFWKLAAEGVTSPTDTGAGKGTGAMETNVDSPTTGTQSEDTGQAKNNQIPTNPGTDTGGGPGQTNPATAIATDMSDVPGGTEDWSKGKDIMKQSSANHLRMAMRKQAFSLTREGHKTDAKYYGGLSKARNDMANTERDFADKSPLTGTANAVRSRVHRLVGRHNDYAAKKHEQGSNAYNPLGGILTPSRGEKKASIRNSERICLVMLKHAEDANNPASMSSKGDTPPDTSMSEEGVPSQPSETTSQKRMIQSSGAAIDYTKGDAKAVPQARMGEVLTEPAQRKSSDPVLHNNLDATSGAGVKLSSVKIAAARAFLKRAMEEGASEDATPEQKEKAEKLQAALKSKQDEKEKGSMGMGTGAASTGASPAVSGGGSGMPMGGGF